jgi:hypothetical protein
MNIREAIDAIVTHGLCHSERRRGSLAAPRLAAKESGVGQGVARRIGGMEHA